MDASEGSVLRKNAKKDWDTAKLICESDNELASIVCYHIQQYVEKMIKAKLVDLGIEYRKSHDIRYLLQLLAGEKLDEKILLEADRLTGYCVNTRYDSYEPSSKETEIAFQIATEMIGLLDKY